MDLNLVFWDLGEPGALETLWTQADRDHHTNPGDFWANKKMLKFALNVMVMMDEGISKALMKSGERIATGWRHWRRFCGRPRIIWTLGEGELVQICRWWDKGGKDTETSQGEGLKCYFWRTSSVGKQCLKECSLCFRIRKVEDSSTVLCCNDLYYVMLNFARWIYGYVFEEGNRSVCTDDWCFGADIGSARYQGAIMHHMLQTMAGHIGDDSSYMHALRRKLSIACGRALKIGWLRKVWSLSMITWSRKNCLLLCLILMYGLAVIIQMSLQFLVEEEVLPNVSSNSLRILDHAGRRGIDHRIHSTGTNILLIVRTHSQGSARVNHRSLQNGRDIRTQTDLCLGGHSSDCEMTG